LASRCLCRLPIPRLEVLDKASSEYPSPREGWKGYRAPHLYGVIENYGEIERRRKVHGGL
jgi:hypothetical protein